MSQSNVEVVRALCELWNEGVRTVDRDADAALEAAGVRE